MQQREPVAFSCYWFKWTGTINGPSLVFVGIDGSTATPVNKILQGTTVRFD